MAQNEFTLGGVKALREAFDRGFTLPEQLEKPSRTAFLTIQAAGRKLLLRAEDAVGSMADVPLTRVPSTRKDLLGVAQIRGEVAAVLDLERLLGASGLVLTNNTVPWAVVVKHGKTPLALGCSKIGGFVWIEDTQVKPDDVLELTSLALD